MALEAGPKGVVVGRVGAALVACATKVAWADNAGVIEDGMDFHFHE